MARRNAPAPFDAKVSGVGIMLESDEAGPQWSEQRVRDLDPQVPTSEEDLAFAQLPPRIERPYAITDLSDGMGLAEQDARWRHRYQYALNVDCSGGMPVKGPQANGQTALAAGITQFIDFNGSLWAACGRYLYQRTSDLAAGWTQVRDF